MIKAEEVILCRGKNGSPRHWSADFYWDRERLRRRPVFCVSLLVSQFADQLNSAINTLTAKYPISSDYATKVVPIITVGDGSYAGAAQVSGPKEQVDKCQAALQLEASFFKSFRAKALIPVDKVAISGINRVQGVGVSAQIDVKI